MLGGALAALALSTLVSEDATSIGAGLLAAEGRLPIGPAVAACIAGVYAGDLMLWLAGRCLGPRILRLPWVAGRVEPATLTRWSERLDTRLGTAVVLSRFVPGSRLPMYLAAGLWSRRPLAFALWSLLAVMIWTPALVLASAWFGTGVLGPLLSGVETGVSWSLLAIAILWATVRAGGGALGGVVARYHQRLDQTIETPI